jgi:outer membrane murein-binding lipoprotein Lpp
MIKGRTQAYPRAPWREQVRSSGRLMFWAVSLLILGAMYLAVSAKEAELGRQVLTYDAQIEQLERQLDELRTAYARESAPPRMLARASALGMRPARSQEIHFLPLEGYTAQGEFLAPRPRAAIQGGEPMLPPAYTETWLQIVLRWMSGGESR